MACLRLFALIILFAISSVQASGGDLNVSVFEVLSNGSLKPVIGARICVLRLNAIGGQEVAEMNSNTGVVTLPRLPSGQHTVTVSAEGYRGEQKTVTITGTQSSSAAFSLKPCTGSNCGPVCYGVQRTLAVEVKQGVYPYARIAGARVCFGTTDIPHFYGSALTGPDGEPATISFLALTPNVIMTVGKADHRGRRRTVNLTGGATSNTLSLTVPLFRGSGGPSCPTLPTGP
jgi:hypothetical protein